MEINKLKYKYDKYLEYIQILMNNALREELDKTYNEFGYSNKPKFLVQHYNTVIKKGIIYAIYCNQKRYASIKLFDKLNIGFLTIQKQTYKNDLEYYNNHTALDILKRDLVLDTKNLIETINLRKSCLEVNEIIDKYGQYITTDIKDLKKYKSICKKVLNEKYSFKKLDMLFTINYILRLELNKRPLKLVYRKRQK